jgi:ubiquitin-protein ligase
MEETLNEKWRPVLGVEAVVVSVISMLVDPNINSPANIDASVITYYPNFIRSCSKIIVRNMKQKLEN